LPKETTLNNGEKSVALSVYAREKKEGFSMVYQKDEDFFGEFHEDVPAGFGVKIYKDQRALAGLFQGETITGPAFYFANKSLSIGKMKEGVFDGSVTRFVDGGSVYEEVYQNGQKVAEKKLPLSFSSFYPNFYVEENFSGTWIRSQGQALYGKRYIARCCLDGYNEYNGARLLVRTGNELLIDHYVAHQPGPQQFSRIGNVDGVHVRYGLSFLDGGKDFAKVLQYDTLKKELAFGFKNGTADSTKFIYNEESGLLSYPRPAMSNSNPLAEGVDSYKDALESLVGLEGVKKALLGVRAFVNKNKKVTGVALAFLGNPGTGKNTVAKIFSGILVESGAFPSKVFVELNRANLAEGGSSASFENVVDNAFLKAKSGVLYFENFPSFFENPLRTGYDTAKVAIFVNLMHKYDGTCCPIVSGPILAMNDLLNSDPTLRACFSDLVIFPDYNVEELRRLLDNELKKDNYEMNEDAKTSLVEFVYSFHFQNGYSNIALLSKALRGVIKHQNIRTVDSESDDRLLTLADVDELKKEDISLMGVQQEAQEDCEKELENLVGLKEVKEQLRQLKDYLALNQGHSNLSLNMTFTGNPGTGKTTVARLFGGILKKEGFLSNGHLVECDRSGLVAQYIGQTQKLTHEKFQSALGGVLFIDEAYQLAHKDDSRDFGSEAVAALLKDMEDYKGKICVILAGYKAPMQEMLATNQGFQSRIQFEIAFPDYTKEELGQILDKDLAKEGFTMDEEGRAFFLEEIEKKRALPTFANARTVRDALHGVELAASERLVANSSHTRLITKEDVEKHFLKGNPDLAKVSLPETTLPQEVIDSSQEEFLQSGTPVDEALLTDATLTLIGKDGFQRMGTLVSPKGLFLTTLEGLPEGELSTILRVLTYDKRALFFTLGAKLLSVNKKNNLALFTLLQAPQNLAYLPLASSMNLLDGAPLEALSCPQGLGNLALLEVTKATLSSKEGQAPKLIYEGKSGNEGSPLLDKNQKGIVGILNSDASTYIPSEAILDFFR
jgi:AAA+ superfamily predicted ATPase